MPRYRASGATFICDALETDWLAGAAGFEHLHSRIGIAKTLSSPIPVVRAKPDQIAAISAKSFPVGSLQAGAMAWDTDKSRRYLRLAAENDKRAAATENARLKALFSKMAVQYRDLADQMDDPEIASVQAKQK
jgi:hypothetical protein